MIRRTHGESGRRATARLRDLLPDQRGNATILLALMITPLLAFVGVATDGVLAIMVQSRLQAATDSAALAAGKIMLSQDAEREARRILEANFAPGYLDTMLSPVEISVDETRQHLALTAEVALPTRVMRLFGKEELTIAARTVVHRAHRASEIVLVMDNTGSMDYDGKMPAMKAAALQLVDNLYGSNETKPDLLVGVVPYVATVNIGSGRTNWLAPSDRVRTDPGAFAPSRWKGCVMARPDGHDQDDVTPAQAPFTSYYYASARDNAWPWVDETQGAKNNGRGPNLGCGPEILPLVAEKSRVKAAIEGMAPWHRGGTLGSLGLVWGWRVISPNWRGLWSETPVDHPVDYGHDRTDKIVVMLTDGENQLYDWPEDGAGPGGSDFSAYGRLHDFGYSTLAAARAEVDRRMETICGRMKQEGIVLYTITFGPEPSASTQNLYRRCASAPANYFHAPTNESLADAFQEIGGRLSQLRIVQ